MNLLPTARSIGVDQQRLTKGDLKTVWPVKKNMDATAEIELSQTDLDLKRGRQAKSDVVWEVDKVGTM